MNTQQKRGPGRLGNVAERPDPERQSRGRDHAPRVDRAKALIDASFEVLGQAGLDGFTIRAVLKQAGINRRVFYEHFFEKDDLVLAVFAQSVQRTATACLDDMQGLTDPLERLRCVIYRVAVGDFSPGEDRGPSLRRGAALCREHLRLAERRPQCLDTALEPLLALIIEVIAEGIATGRMRDRSPERQAKLVYNVLSTTVHAELLASHAEAGSLARRKVLAEEIWDFCLSALKVPAS